MTDAELKKYYADLLIIQYRGKQKARATIEALADLVIMNQLPVAVQNGFDIDTAVGAQLDVLGSWVGVSRSGVGVDGPITLNDSDFRQLIKLAIVRNSVGSSLADIQSLLFLFFPGEVLVFDYQNMRMSYLIDSNVGSINLIQMFLIEDLLPKPTGVQLAAVIYVPDLDNLYGFGTYDNPGGTDVHGFNTYDTYDLDAPWLSYGDAIFL